MKYIYIYIELYSLCRTAAGKIFFLKSGILSFPKSFRENRGFVRFRWVAREVVNTIGQICASRVVGRWVIQQTSNVLSLFFKLRNTNGHFALLCASAQKNTFDLRDVVFLKARDI